MRFVPYFASSLTFFPEISFKTFLSRHIVTTMSRFAADIISPLSCCYETAILKAFVVIFRMQAECALKTACLYCDEAVETLPSLFFNLHLEF